MFVQHLHNSPSLHSLTVNQKFLGAAQTAATLEFTNPLKLVENDRKRHLLLSLLVCLSSLTEVEDVVERTRTHKRPTFQDGLKDALMPRRNRVSLTNRKGKAHCVVSSVGQVSISALIGLPKSRNPNIMRALRGTAQAGVEAPGQGKII